MVAANATPGEGLLPPGYPASVAPETFRAAVQAVATKAKVKLPECKGRVEAAVKLVLGGDVVLLDDHTAKVASQTTGQGAYHVVNGRCPCPDYEKAPHNFCKHRLGAATLRRTLELLKGGAVLHDDEPPPHTDDDIPPEDDVPPEPDPEPPPTRPVHMVTPPPRQEPPPEPQEPRQVTRDVPPQFITMVHGRPFVRYVGLRTLAKADGLHSLQAVWTYNDKELSLAQAVAVFKDGRRFVECGDATPSNVGKEIAPHFRRMALTRAKGRALRDALNVNMTTFEELGDLDEE